MEFYLNLVHDETFPYDLKAQLVVEQVGPTPRLTLYYIQLACTLLSLLYVKN